MGRTKPPRPPEPPEASDPDAAREKGRSLASEADSAPAEKEITDDTIFQARIGVESTDTDDDMIIGDLLSNRYFRVNSTGAFLWRIASSEASLSQIVSAFSDEYHLERELSHREVKEFLVTMVRAGLLTHTSA